MTMTLTFLGAARTVTGSKYLLRAGSATVLIDVGLFQGLKELRERNWKNLPINAQEIDAVILTHAHLDHCGYLPRLVGQGFKGRVFCTPGTQDLCRIVLPDSGRIQEEDAENANRGRYSRHAPALPLYTEADAFRAISLLQPVGYDRPMPVAGDIEVDFINAGHLLGSAYARVRTGGKTILFGGDLGRFGRPVLPDPTMVEEADYLLVESTYGNRIHERDDNGEKLAAVIREAADRGGKIIVPAFAIGRVEEIIYWIRKLELEKRIPVLPVFVDSPMALDALARYSERIAELDADMQPEARDEKAPHGPADRDEAPAVEGAGDCHLRERDGHGRPRPASPQGRASRSAQHRAVRGIPGSRHARPANGRRREGGEDPRSVRAGQRAHRARRVDVGARGFAGNPAVARRL
jgi:metallo-beta-lactamase family protein